MTPVMKGPAAAAEIGKEIERAFNARALWRIERVLGRNVLQHSTVPGRSDIRQRLTFLLGVLPDARLRIEDSWAEGKQVWWRWSIEGTHGGEYLGIRPTGRAVRLTGVSIARLKLGVIAEFWDLADEESFLEQLQEQVGDVA
jgi:predicted ester cyclase